MAGVGAAGGGATGFAGTEIIRVYSLGPAGGAVGAALGATRNAWVAPPPGMYAGGGAAGADEAPESDPGPNMRVYSPGSCWGGGGAGGGVACGNWGGAGNCGPAGVTPGDGLKNFVNSPPAGGGGPTSGGGVWNMRVNSPGSGGLAAGGGQSPWGGASGIGD
jgi:hypothetical protein